MADLHRALAVLRAESLAGRSRAESPARPPLTSQEARQAQAEIEAAPDAGWYLALLALRREHPALYEALSARARAQVLCAALRGATYCNDWGYLDAHEAYDGEAARALLALGDAAVPPLQALLADLSPAPLFGSEAATRSAVFGYRRADFAYRYLRLLRGEPADFAADLTVRDARLAALIAELGAEE